MQPRGRLFSVPVALVLGLAGCGKDVEPDRSRLREGSEAVVLDPHATAIRVTTAREDGLGGNADFNYLHTGETVLVTNDSGGDLDPKRNVTVVAREGDMKGKMARIPREFLRPR